MKKHRMPLVLLVILLVASSILCGTVIAYMFRQTESIDNKFTPAKVSCEVVEDFDGTQKTSIQVKNTGNIDAYLRLRMVSYWVDNEGNIVAKPSVLPEIFVTSDWIKGPNNTYYYKTTVSPEKQTNSLLSKPIILEKDENGYKQVIEVFAEAIQSKPHSAVVESWGVLLDTNGYIVP